MLTGEKKRTNQIILLISIILMILAMTYTGTRTANAMLVAGLLFFIFFTFERRSSRAFLFFGSIIFLIVLYGPFNNSTLNRFRTTFSASQDASFNVREVNRKSVQSYMHSHPIGGGLATTGATGHMYNPGHPLAGFQPDSSYVKKAVEIGPIGLAIYCLLYFLILKSGISGYFASTNPRIKLIYAGATCAIFCFYVGEYAQKAIGQITDVVIYYPLIIMLLRLKNYNHVSHSGINNNLHIN